MKVRCGNFKMAGFISCAGGAFTFRTSSLQERRAVAVNVQHVARRRVGPCMQGYSDSRPLLEYFESLNRKPEDVERLRDQASVIVGSGRLGTFLANVGRGDDLVLPKGGLIPPDHPGPVYACVPAAQLETVVSACPESKLEDLVLVQEGAVESLFRRLGLQDNTRAHLCFCIPRLGGKPREMVAEDAADEDDGLTLVTGKWATAFAERIERAELKCSVVFSQAYRRGYFEKLVWLSALHLIGSVHGGLSLSETAAQHRDELEDLTYELARFIRFGLAVSLLHGTADRACLYAATMAHVKADVREDFDLRCGFFYGFAELAKAKGLESPVPMLTDYMEDGKARGLIDW
ncbi:hypothetical protein FVE85_6341 [Porphyridium purpureum]|uniref:Uncharacterized protein n=1 Tax=Porphyridium purpureum TaxID=35688 RepID=A0A5J4Z4Z9_PORPP|nr:hypothetical protein FVE85_6341 [Porphyridium purpureum]|eukprot:POR5739..scf295_1